MTQNNEADGIVTVGFSLAEVHAIRNMLSDWAEGMALVDGIGETLNSILPGLSDIMPSMDERGIRMLAALQQKIEIAHEVICTNDQPIPYSLTDKDDDK